jgi:hypothetical protein
MSTLNPMFKPQKSHLKTKTLNLKKMKTLTLNPKNHTLKLKTKPKHFPFKPHPNLKNHILTLNLTLNLKIKPS